MNLKSIKPMVKKTLTGKYRLNLEHSHRAALKEEVLNVLEGNLHRQIKTGQQVAFEVAYSVIEDFWYKCNGLHAPGDQRFTVNRQTAAAIILILIKDKRPDMIYLKAELLRAL